MSERVYEDAERRLGRKLSAAERHIDITRLNRDLESGKQALTDAIETEKRRSIRARLKQQQNWRPQVTGEMISILEGLHARGRETARRELRSMGYLPERQFQSPDDEEQEAARKKLLAAISAKRSRSTLYRLKRAFNLLLQAIGLRIDREVRDGKPTLAVGMDTAAQRKIEREMEKRVPGSKDLAGRLISGALYSGLGATFEEHQDLIPCWEYSAIMDNATCAPCRKADGSRFQGWEAAMLVLPNGGPNPLCLGDGRCRCRLVPCLPGSDTETGKLPELVEQRANDLLRPPTHADLDAWRWEGTLTHPSPELVKDIVWAQNAVDSALTVRTETPIRAFPVAQIEVLPGRGGGKTTGSFARTTGGEPAYIVLARTHPRGSFLHEYGHFVDSILYRGDGKFVRSYGSQAAERRQGDRGEGRYVDAYERLMAVIVETGGIQRLIKMRRDPVLYSEFTSDGNFTIPDDEYLDYLLQPHEMFARAFEAYIETKVRDDVQLLEQDRMARFFYPQGFTAIHRLRLVEAFDKFFEEVGWTP